MQSPDIPVDVGGIGFQKQKLLIKIEKLFPTHIALFYLGADGLD